MKNNYKKLVTHCLFLAKTVVIVGLTLLSLKSSAQYCISGATQLNDDDIGAFSFGNFSNVQSTQALNNSTSINTYTNFTYLSPVQAQQGSYYPINITQINSSNSFYQCTAVIYIDFNHSNTFDAGEDVYRGITVAGINGNVLNGFVYIPTSALTGNARMRVVLSEDPSTTACGNYSWGETEDYKINIAAAVPCSGTPTAGSLSINDTSVCVGTNLSIMLSGNSQGTGVTSQWEISTDGVSFTATGDTLALLNITSPSDSIYYRVKVSCNGGLPVYTLITKIKASPNYLCYCKSNLGASCFGAIISNVAIASTLLNNSSNCSVGYDLYYPTTSTTTTNLKQAQNYVVTVNTNSATSGGVWIDTDASGTFDASEYSALAFNGGLTASTNLLIPSSGTLGNIGMRVRVAQYTWNAVNANTSCTNLYGGEIEDYIVNIIPGTPCVGTPTAGMLNFTDTAICTGSSLSIILNGNTQGTGITTTWEISTDGVSYTATGDSLPLLTINLSSDSIYYRVKVSCNGGTPAYSTVAKIKASPANQCYCTANLGGYCGSGQTNDFSIASTTLSNLNSGCGTNFGIANYSKFPASGNTTASLIQAVTYTFNGKFDVNVQQAAIWIDLDHSGTFDAIEYYQWPAPSANTTPLAILIPASAQVGATGLRIRSRAAGFSASDACNQFGSGETEDYIITIAPGTPCSGAPTAGVLSASNLIPCPSTTDTLSITGTTQALGITHTWETSINGINFTATGDSTLSLIDFGINSGDSIYYRVAVACNGGTPVYTNIVKLKANINIYTCYCNTNLGADCSGAIISNVNILSTTLNSNSACTTGYNFYYPTTTTTTADIKQAVGYTINVNAPTAVVGGVWLDLDHSGTFDGAEYHPLTFTGAAGTTTVFLPANT
ncbi:MAG: hypothetical protein H7331_10735, partial [Bacteroidia bacterium]|nr:hypothetical protein [Bacteroidia bacterium]